MISNINFDKYDWVWFDLDGTLHDFKHSSSLATKESLKYFCESMSLPYSEVKNSFNDIFKNSQQNYFIDGRTSVENRKERFISLADAYIEHGNFSGIEKILEIYKSTIISNLKPYDNALKFLKALKKQNKNIAIVSEAPHDAQEIVLNELGYMDYCDILITSSKERIDKKQGLFKRSLEITKAQLDNVLIIGDMVDRDINPAIELKIDACLIDHQNLHKENTKIKIVKDFQSLLDILGVEKA